LGTKYGLGFLYVATSRRNIMMFSLGNHPKKTEHFRIGDEISIEQNRQNLDRYMVLVSQPKIAQFHHTKHTLW
jgi:hypothetical protein